MRETRVSLIGIRQRVATNSAARKTKVRERCCKKRPVTYLALQVMGCCVCTACQNEDGDEVVNSVSRGRPGGRAGQSPMTMVTSDVHQNPHYLGNDGEEVHL